jgi:hypothetical protein
LLSALPPGRLPLRFFAEPWQFGRLLPGFPLLCRGAV